MPASPPQVTPWGRLSSAVLHLEGEADRARALRQLARPLVALAGEAGPSLALCTEPLALGSGGDGPQVRGVVTPRRPESLGGGRFNGRMDTRFPYVAGAMANGIASVELVLAMARAGMLGVFGAAGLGVPEVERAGRVLLDECRGLPFGMNLIHSPYEPELERAVVDLYLRLGIRCVSASAYLDLTPAIVRYRVAGIGPDGVARNKVLAKISRVELARKFLAPPPSAILDGLVSNGELSPEQAARAASVPMADELIVEADSGGHTDNRPAVTLVPTMIGLRDRAMAETGHYVGVGAAGGMATPQAVAAAFGMGADFVVTGSINQACQEAGTSPAVRELLAGAQQADITMAPAADMFEMGVKLQVLKRGTMFPMRAHKLYELYRAHGSLDEVAPADRASLERTIFRKPLAEVWQETEAFWRQRDPSQLERANRDPKHRMALVFRWYLGQSSRWANAGVADRKIDYQVWCGPAMGAFNEWTRGSHLQAPESRRAADVARNLLHGACVVARHESARAQGVSLAPADVSPLPVPQLEELEA